MTDDALQIPIHHLAGPFWLTYKDKKSYRVVASGSQDFCNGYRTAIHDFGPKSLTVMDILDAVKTRDEMNRKGPGNSTG